MIAVDVAPKRGAFDLGVAFENGNAINDPGLARGGRVFALIESVALDERAVAGLAP